VLRVLTDRDGRTDGVEYLDPLGQVRTFHARTVIVASYTFETVRLLMLSADAGHPHGLGGSTGQLGRHFMFKQWGDVYGHLPDTTFNSHTGPAAQMVTLDDFNSADFDSVAHGFVGGEPAVAAADRPRSAALRGARLGAALPAAVAPLAAHRSGAHPARLAGLHHRSPRS
jgi:choline dehydrogenase-like flavoprotein